MKEPTPEAEPDSDISTDRARVAELCELHGWSEARAEQEVGDEKQREERNRLGVS